MNWLKKLLPKVLYIAVFTAIWQAVVTSFKLKVYILPGPFKVLGTIFGPGMLEKNQWFRHIGATLTEVGASLLATVVVGIVLAILITWSKMLSQLLMPIITMFNSLPKIAMAPLFLLWFGYGLLPNILIAILSAFFPLVINAVTGLNAVDDDLLNLVKYLHASKLQIFVKIRIPNSLPYIFAGIKISTTFCVVGSIVGEFIASEKGLGYLICDAQAFVDLPTIFACLILLSLMGFLLFTAIEFIEKICMPWNHRKVGV
ncbi:MAG: ABC transporter permease [Treponema sp.]|jgi:NitT/TauT family transport system permease protein|nr:ABC transporter permease [Treponema sp.]